jgi:exodeoxyribonuclease-3
VVDLGRKHAGEVEGPYTWWSWRGQAFDNNAGWRIDYHVATSKLATHCKEIVVGRADTYAQRWSDHAPVTAKFNL